MRRGDDKPCKPGCLVSVDAMSAPAAKGSSVPAAKGAAPATKTPAPAPKSTTPPPGSGGGEAEQPSCSGGCFKKRIGIALAATAVVAAVAIPILCAVCGGEDDDEDEKDVKLTGNAMLEKLVGWVKEVKGGNSDADEEDGDSKYKEIASVADFSKAQSL